MAQCNCPLFAPAARWMGTRPSHFQNKEDNHNRNANYCIQLKNIRAKFFYQRRKLRHAILHRAFSFLTLPSLWKNHIIARAGRQGPVVLSLLKENALESTFLTGFTKRKAKNKKPGKAHNNRLFEAFCLVRPTGFEPAAFRVGAERSIHLSYGRKYRCLFRAVQTTRDSAISTGVSTLRFPRDSLAHPLAPRVVEARISARNVTA